MQSRIDPNTADYDGSRIADLGNAVYLRLMTPRGTYWSDPNFGSRLHLLRREKDLARVALLAKQYAEEALQPLLDDDRATAVRVTTPRIDGRMRLGVEVEDATGGVQYFEHPVEVA
jgi:phage gp46-like protein